MLFHFPDCETAESSRSSIPIVRLDWSRPDSTTHRTEGCWRIELRIQLSTAACYHQSSRALSKIWSTQTKLSSSALSLHFSVICRRCKQSNGNQQLPNSVSILSTSCILAGGIWTRNRTIFWKTTLFTFISNKASLVFPKRSIENFISPRTAKIDFWQDKKQKSNSIHQSHRPCFALFNHVQ